MAQLIKTIGITKEVIPNDNKFFTLEELQEAVGGIIEFIYLPENKIMIVNEEGEFLRLPLNREATRIIRETGTGGCYIVGDVLIINESEIE